MDITLAKLQKQHSARDKDDWAQVVARLAELEVHYQLTSDVFMARYDAGQMSDDADYVEWRAYCKMRQRLEERLNIPSVVGQPSPVASTTDSPTKD